MADPLLPARLRDEVGEAPAPVRPLRPPARRISPVAFWGLALLAVVPLVWGLRADHAEVGAWRLWGASAVQAVLALAVAAAALAESMPGRRPSRRAVGLVVLLGLAAFAGATALTFAASATSVPAAHAARYAWVCFSRPFLLGLPALAVLGVLAARGLASRPVLLGALAGLAAGLASDAGWRLFCEVSDPRHVLAAHAGAIGALTALGAAAGAVSLRRAGAPGRPRSRP